MNHEFYGMPLKGNARNRKFFRGSDVCFGGGQPSTATTTSKSEPWDQQKPYLEYGFQQARNQYDKSTPAQYYGGQQVADLNPDQQTSYGMVRQQVSDPNSVVNTATKNLNDTMNGTYLNPASNPFLSDSVKLATRDALGAADSAASRYGAYGSSDWNNTRQQTASDIATKMYGDNYNNERNRQLQAYGLAPTVNQAGLSNAQTLNTMGGQQQNQAQQLINADMNKWNYLQNADWQNLQKYMQLVQGNYGGTSTQTTPYYQPNPMTQALGGLMSIGSFFL